MNIRDVLHISLATIATSSPTPQLDAEVLLAFVLQKDRSWLHAHGEDEITQENLTTYNAALKRRTLGDPVAYIVGYKEFYGRNFTVSADVLVPRPESESFIDLLKELSEVPAPKGIHHVLDMGTGSGCLAISTKLELPQLYVTATDTSTAALAVAAHNALAYACPITFKTQSLLTGDKEGYDAILANLPYVPNNMKDPSIAKEPDEALYSGADGLDHYRQLFTQLGHKHIRYVLIESLLNQHAAVSELALSAQYELTKTQGLVQLFSKTTKVTDLLEKR